MSLEVGQKLWFVPNSRRGNPKEVTVEKVGRRWATLDISERVDVNTLEVDAGEFTTWATCYLSEEDHRKIVELSVAWSDFAQELRSMYSRPKSVTLEDIVKCREILGMKKQEN